MFNRYFQQELANLRDLGYAFSKAHPAVAPMLSGQAADPDVERLLEGVAFLTGLLREKLDDEFPEIVHELIRLIWPHYLRPIPSATIVAFKPKAMLKQTMTIPRESQISSMPIEGTMCLFRTCYDVELHPIHLLDASFVEAAGSPPCIKLLLELRGLKPSDWAPKALRLFIDGDYALASDIYFYLRYHLQRVEISPFEQGSPCILSSDCVKPVGFSFEEGLIPYPSNSFIAYRALQEFFVLPEKFLFLDITGWEKFTDRGESGKFEIKFELDSFPTPAPRIRKENFVLSATPAVNIFGHDADPIRLDHKKTEYQLRPSGIASAHYQIYSVEGVIGYIQGTAQQRQYQAFEMFNPQSKSDPVYNTALRSSPLEQGFNVYLSVAYPQEAGTPVSETLSIRLLCTNGALPASLRVGDISMPTSSSPEFAEFENIRAPSVNVLPPLGSNLLWRLLSHLSLNYVSLGKAENLRALLDLYIFPDSRDRKAVIANQKRIEGIHGIEVKAANRLVSGVMMRGHNLQLKMSLDHFASQGDLYLFGCVLDYFLGAYASLNTFTQFHVEDVIKGDHYKWPARVGDRFLI